MLLKKISIENFRQYNGLHEIIFSTDKDKKVTLIMGDNGTGKTTLSQAFLWCLYGTTPAFLKKESLFSKKEEKAMYEGWDRRTRVTIEMEHNKKSYTVSREKAFKKVDAKIKETGTHFSISYIDGGEKKFVGGKEIDDYINEILPENLSQYFFLSGEKIGAMAFDIKYGKSKDFANAVNTLLDLDYNKAAIKHLKNIAKEYDTSSVDGFDNKLDEYNSDIESADRNIKSIEERKKELEEKETHFDEAIADLKYQLKNTTSSKDLETKRQKLQAKVDKSQTDSSIEIESGISQFVKKAPYFFAQASMKTALETLKEISETEDDDIPEKLHADLIDWIEKRGKCVCGTTICEGDEHFELLEKWRHIVPPESIGTLVKSVKDSTIQKFRIGKDLLEYLKDKRAHVYQYSDDIESWTNEINEISEKIASTTDTSDMERQLRQYLSDRDASKAETNDAIRMLVSLEEEKKAKEKERSNLLKTNKEGRKVLAWKKMTEQLIEGFDRNLKNDENKKRTKLVEKVKDHFKKMYGNSFSIDINEEYKITTTSPDLEKSDGEGMTVIFAFLAGLLDVIKDNQKENSSKESVDLKLESYPLVLDAPFSVLDETRISAICDILPKVSEQIIILIKDTDGKIAKEKMRTQIGKSYRLKKADESGVDTIIEEDVEV